MVLTMVVRHTQQEPSENSQRQGLLLISPGNYVTYQGPHSKITSRENVWAWDAASIGVEGRGLDSLGLTLYG